MRERARECVCVCVSECASVRVRVAERENVYAGCVWETDREIVCVCAYERCERERGRVCVCMRGVGEGESVCETGAVNECKRESARAREGECVCVTVFKCVEERVYVRVREGGERKCVVCASEQVRVGERQAMCEVETVRS